uniref:Reverse transcriptase RNase H-like domain-containing protein n=1 Tax=Amphimedon queenslandica TaxID=400682 RepID=A0A1X7SFR9_AMPQE
MKDVLQKHFDPKPSPIVQRFKFHTRVRKQDETVATYVAELRVIGEHCDFQDSLDAMIRDRLVCGINSIRIQRRLLQEPDLDYDKAFQIAQAMELAAHDDADHLNNLHAVLQTLEEAGLTLKQSKCKFGVPSVEYLGHIIDSDGLHPSEAKVKAIREAPTPTNVTELKSFLGLLNYYHKFLPDVATVLSPLHLLLRKDTPWKWSQDQEKAFQKAKAMLHSSSVLTHYDEKKPLVVACDASPYGLGAVLSHRMSDGTDLPVAYASRTLSAAEKKYSQLEKEALAIIFAVRKFHDYIYGRKFVLHSDHKPLQFLLSESKQIPLLASSRIQRWAIALSAYNY